MNEYPKLVKLDVTGNKMGLFINEPNSFPQDMIYGFKINNTMKILILDENGIDNNGAKIIGTILKLNKGLTDLSLKKNLIGNLGAKELLNGLKKNKTLKSLNLDDNRIDSVLKKEILDDRNDVINNLIILKHEGNKIENNKVLSLGELLKNNQSLTILDNVNQQSGLFENMCNLLKGKELKIEGIKLMMM